MESYKQFDIVWAKFPLSDKINKTKLRPALIISNKSSNDLDNDILVCGITSKIRNEPFSFVLYGNMLSEPLETISEIRCNKIMTIRNTMIEYVDCEVFEEFHNQILALVLKSIEIPINQY